jgi:hypothetical protein
MYQAKAPENPLRGLSASNDRGVTMLTLILLVFAFVLFFIAGLWNPAPPSPWFGRLIAFGLAAWVLSLILAGKPLF